MTTNLAMPSITTLVPVYDEIATVSDSVRKIHDFMRSLACTFEILIIESGSSDGTAEACDLLALQLSDVIVVHEGRRNGFGAALRLGFAKATNDLIWVVPVDLPYSLSLLREALRQIDNCEAVLSVRRSDDRSRYRRLQSHIYTWLCTLLCSCANLGIRRMRPLNFIVARWCWAFRCDPMDGLLIPRSLIACGSGAVDLESSRLTLWSGPADNRR
jgi:glycosyltransferase involved in cell wall biosynthesis